MRCIDRIEVPALLGSHCVGLEGAYMGHQEPCESSDHFKVRDCGIPGKPDVIKTFAKEN
jgi:hypothetical protein